MPHPSVLIQAIWAAWALSWILAAFWSAPPTRRATSTTLLVAYALIAASILIPIAWSPAGLPITRAWEIGSPGAYSLAGAIAAGLLFAWWGRLYLGTLWSAAIVAKADHRIVRGGPFAIVRHPIYTGILWAALVTDGVDATVPAALSFVCLALGFWLKGRLEERFLAEVFDPSDYAAYRRAVPMLVPFWPPRG